MILYCIRHGQSDFNAQGRIQGQLDVALSPLGHQQGQAVAQALAGQKFDALFSSPLSRALDTANYLAKVLHLEVRTDDRLKEINAGVFQGLTWPEIEERFPEAAARWRTHDPEFCIPEGESRLQLMQRGRAALEAIREVGCQNVLVVAHGGLISAAIKALLEIPATRNPFELRNCSITRLGWRDQFKLLSLNQIDHLQALGPEPPGVGPQL